MRTKLLAAERRAAATDPHALVDADPLPPAEPEQPPPGTTTLGGALRDAFVWGAGMTVGMIVVRALFGF